ncbi:TonB-dependent receptor [Tolypothrix campylonemoides VB511288]|nr:TonB-dependent receptor [Tolypothrix campylonemoides VB511288]
MHRPTAPHALPRRRLLTAALLLALAAPAVAQQAPPPGDPHREPVDLDSIVVTASPLGGSAEDISRPVEVLAGERLDEVKASSIGETVSRLPGVQSSYFGPGVGRPIIRGLDGARVQVLSEGLASADASTVSVDHAVTIEPFLADQIEVLKGPATLLYGSGAIGGAVNVVDGRIPERATEQPFQGRAELRGNTVNDERTGMFRVDGTGLDGRLVLHADGLVRRTDDYEIPGFAESRALREEEAAEGEEHEQARDVLPNSAVKTDAGALGATLLFDRGFFGVGASLFNTRYGIPGGAHEHEDEEEPLPGEEEEEEEAAVRLELDQRRYEVRGGLNDLGAFESLRVKVAHTDYTHTEFEGAEIGTVFDNTTTEGRVELVHAPWGGWRGAFGVQGSKRDFEAVGEEAFVPPSEARDVGLFWIGERDFGPVRVELGARLDRTRIETVEQELLPDRRLERDFDTESASAALRWNISNDFHLSLGLDRAQRAPTAEELYSNGFHVATDQIEVGTDSLREETANRIELGAHWHTDRVTVGASIYHVRYDDFIYLSSLGSTTVPGEVLTDGGDVVTLWTQADARFNGAEAEVDVLLADNASGEWNVRLFGDYVRGELDGGDERVVPVVITHGDHNHNRTGILAADGTLPRIAPMRVGGELRWARGPLRASLGAIRYDRQDKVAELESETPGYTLVDAHVAWHQDTAAGNAWEIFLDGTNLTDEEARLHTSFLKDVAPLPGRGVAFGVRMFF